MTGSRLGVALREGQIAVVALKRGKVTHSFVLEAQENPAALLLAELESRKVGTRGACVGIARQWATVKTIELPPAVGGSLAQMVAFELERHLPFPAEDASFDFTPLRTKKGGALRVLVVAAERRTVERALHLLEEAGLRPLALGVGCHDLPALAGKPPRQQRTVWLHAVGEEIDLLCLDGRELALSRSFPIGDDDSLAAEVGKSLALLRWEECHACWVSGDRTARLEDSPALAALVRCPLSPPPWSQAARRALAGFEGSNAGILTIALASALAPRRQRLSLLPEAVRPRPIHWSRFATAASLAVTALLGIGLLFAQGFQDRRHLASVTRSIRSLDQEIRSVEALIEAVEKKRRLLSTLKSVEGSGTRPLPILREITEILPADAWLTSLTVDSKGIELTGQASAANQLIPLLENSPLLRNAEFASPVTKGREKEQFRIRALPETPAAQAAALPAATPAGVKPALPQRKAR